MDIHFKNKCMKTELVGGGRFLIVVSFYKVCIKKYDDGGMSSGKNKK